MTREALKAFVQRHPLLCALPLALLLASGMWGLFMVILVGTLRAMGVIPAVQP